MSSLVGSSFRRHPRYPITDHTGTTAMIDPGRADAEPLTAILLDISLCGAKFETTAPIATKDVISITIESTFPRQTIEVDAQVTWVNPVRPGTWQLGCSFATKVSAEALESFARAGVLERRRQARSVASLAAMAKCELKAEEIPVSILDFSTEGGFRLLSSSPVPPHSRLELRIQSDSGEVLVRGKSLWECTSEAGYHVGCEFLTIQDSLRLTEILDDSPDTTIACGGCLRTLQRTHTINRLALLVKRRRFRQLLCCSAGACVVALLGLSLASGLSPSNEDRQRLSSAPATGSASARRSRVGESNESAVVGNRQGDLSGVQSAVVATSDVAHRQSEGGEGSHGLDAIPPEQQEEGLAENLTIPVSLTGEPLPPKKHGLATDIQTQRFASRPLAAPATASAVEVPEHDESSAAEHAASSHAPTALAQTEDTDSSPIEQPVSSDNLRRARTHFEEGCRHYRNRQYREALGAFQSATRATPGAPLNHYFLALVQYELQHPELAEQSVAQAATLERVTPIKDWGRRMERYQGPSRAWLEQARRQALQNASTR